MLKLWASRSRIQEFEDSFPAFVAELKGIIRELGEMKIVPKPNANSVKHWSYRLNPRVKEKVKKDIDKLWEAGLIFPVHEVEWISSICIENNKDTEEM